MKTRVYSNEFKFLVVLGTYLIGLLAPFAVEADGAPCSELVGGNPDFYDISGNTITFDYLPASTGDTQPEDVNYWVYYGTPGDPSTINYEYVPGGNHIEEDRWAVNEKLIMAHGRFDCTSYDEVIFRDIYIRATVYTGADTPSDHLATGNLEIAAKKITVKANTWITSTGSGYTGRLCDEGQGPLSAHEPGGRGGCSGNDSAGGGGHFGEGGKGKDDSGNWERDCGRLVSVDPSTNSLVCGDTSPCNGSSPTNEGESYFHLIWNVEYGAGGGDKGCRDGDGFNQQPAEGIGGTGGGRLVLAGIAEDGSGEVVIESGAIVSADGFRGCGGEAWRHSGGTGNDAAGGGAGGSVLIVGDHVTIENGARISAAGGVGGDTRGVFPSESGGDFYRGQVCPKPKYWTQRVGSTCDDCAGGGGGGIVSVLSRQSADIDPGVEFDIAGGLGGACASCQAESGGGAGELQISGGYGGEICDGFDNDFDGNTDDLGNISCDIGSCEKEVPACVDGARNYCISFDDPSCLEKNPGTQPRLALIVDTSGSMLTDLSGNNYTFGDGSQNHPGIDIDGNGEPDDSRLYKAKTALSQVIAAYPEVDWSLARFIQDQGVDRSCQLATWFECEGICCTYDNPRDNVPDAGLGVDDCQIVINGGPTGVQETLDVYPTSPSRDQCINYAGSCGSEGNGADILAGFGSGINQYLMWMNHRETNFIDSRVAGDYCDFGAGGDCELRGTGPTPLADSLESVRRYLESIRETDEYRLCRNYYVILLTDGSETCDGDPESVAREIYENLATETLVIGFSVEVSEQTELQNIALAGSGDARSAYFVSNEVELATTLAEIVAGSIKYETCDGTDEDCDGLTDEDFPTLGDICDDGQEGDCLDQGVYVCAPDKASVVCDVLDDDNGSGVDETCDGKDNNCNGEIDENGCDDCIPSGDDVCDDKDNDCDGETDEDFVSTPCGSDEGECEKGNTVCDGGQVSCDSTEGTAEICDNLDNDCDGETDEILVPCYPAGEDGCAPADPTDCEGVCRPGTANCDEDCVGAVTPSDEICDEIDNDCDGQTDETFSQKESPCGETDKGICALGEWLCQDGDLRCIGEVTGEASELVEPFLCNNLDDDCDGFTDEDAENKSCGSDIGICESGTMKCHEKEPGVWVYECDGAQGGTIEACNGLDDDCNGFIDDGVESGITCTNSQTDDPNEGECEEGFLICVAGGWECSAPDIGDEICDGKDNDCDGLTDEDTPIECPAGICLQGECALPCTGEEFSCPIGHICQEGPTGIKACVPDICDPSNPDVPPCVENKYYCDDGYVPPCHCNPIAQKCVDSCYGTQCPAGKVCVPKSGGNCLPQEQNCYVEGCEDSSKICSNGKCVDDPCDAADCPEGTYCNKRGECVSPCVDIDCPEGLGCYEGKCVDDPCAGVNCRIGTSCNEGECRKDVCQNPACEFYQICRDGDCLENPCWNIKCPRGFLCIDGGCYDPDDTSDGQPPDHPRENDTDSGGGDDQDSSMTIPELNQVLATGTGGCQCSSTPGRVTSRFSSVGWLSVLLLFGMLIYRRRPSMVRSSAVLVASLLLIGCDVNPYKFTSIPDTDPSGSTASSSENIPDSSGDDSDSNTDPGSATDDADAGTDPECDTAAKDNDCDGIDDDCDGQTDEEVNTATNPYHCGGCGEECTYKNALGECIESECRLGECNPGFHDFDSDDSNGCETYCSPSSAFDLCNGVDLSDIDAPYTPLDDDCDGDYDEDVNFSSDITNCGRCGQVCVYEHASAVCDEGECSLELCDDGFLNLNQDPQDGCEYVCQIDTNSPDEICDNKDNDCDGLTDETHGETDLLGLPCFEGETGCGGSPLMCKGECRTGVVACVGGVLICSDEKGPQIERCNNLDDDCDGVTDNSFNKLTSLTHCGDCDQPCNLPNAVSQCTAGECGVLSCNFGFVDNDPAVPGCEYSCTITGAEICDGKDNDCDGATDGQDDNMQVPDAIATMCRGVGECEGSTAACREIGGATSWYCNYGDTVEIPNPDSPNQVAVQETLCDSKDNDCDGATDESFPLVVAGEACTEQIPGQPSTGICLSRGHYVCDETDQLSIRCQIDQPGQPPLGSEVCNGKDDDCDGETDEGEIDEIVYVDWSGSNFSIYKYEASRTDSSASNPGIATIRSCSKPGVRPWSGATYAQAEAACSEAGKRLCTQEEWVAACEGTANTRYPYGNDYAPVSCNGTDYPKAAGGDPLDSIFPTGSLVQCLSDVSVFDMSGNLREWTSEKPDPAKSIYVLRGGSFNTPEAGLSCEFAMSQASGEVVLPAIGFRCCMDE